MCSSDQRLPNKRQTNQGAAGSRSGSVAERLERLGTTTLSDALESLGLRGECAELRSLGSGAAVIAGRAVTVELGPVNDAAGPVHLGAAAIDGARPGDVIVVSNRGPAHAAAWGGLLSSAAVAAGVAGVVIDGLCRDVDEVRAAGLSVFARGATPLTARGRVVERATGEAVRLGNREVRPGDWVVADSSGVVIVPAESCDEVRAVADELAALEADMQVQLRRGVPVAQVLDQRYERMLRR